VEDEDGHVYYRGQRMAVCDKTFHLLQQAPYSGMFFPVEPRQQIPLEDAEPFACRSSDRRHPRETKGEDYDATSTASGSCGATGGTCC
jgi:hypothetical protein